MNRPKHLVSVLAVLLALVLLFSVLYIALGSNHDCCGESCTVCAAILACENLLRNLLPISLLLPAFQRLCAAVLVFVNAECLSVFTHTLIALKVKLSD